MKIEIRKSDLPADLRNWLMEIAGAEQYQDVVTITWDENAPTPS